MLKKGAKVHWTEEALMGVRECIRALTESPVLKFPDFTKTFIITTDASAYALGAVLSQEYEDGDHPVAFASRRLTPTECRYSAIERELLGIVWAIEHFRPYVFGRNFLVKTDHKPLQWVAGMKESSARVSRWKERLMAYQFEVQHTPGTSNVVADWLSRAIEANAMEEAEPSTSLRQFFEEWTPDEEQEEEGEEDIEDVSRSREEPFEIAEVDDIVNSKSRQIRWLTHAEGNPRIWFKNEGRKKVYEAWSVPGVSTEEIDRVLKGVLKRGKRYHLYVGNEVLWRKLQRTYQEGVWGDGCEVIRCKRMVETVLRKPRQLELAGQYHVGKTNHRGVGEMVQALQRRYYWEKMAHTAEEVTRQCQVCCRVKPDTRPPVGIQEMTRTPTKPMQRLEIDTFIWDGKWITVIDVFSKLLLVTQVTGRVVKAVLEALQDWCRHYGTPEEVVSDCGSEFKNREVQAEAKRLDIRWHYNIPGHQQGRGVVERVHGTISDHLRILATAHGVKGLEAMQRATLAYNHSVHSVTGYSPIEVVFGMSFRRRDEELTAPEGGAANPVRAARREQYARWSKVREKIMDEKARRVLQHNVRTQDVSARLVIGSVVYRRIDTNRRKQEERFDGPYRVIAIFEHNRYLLERCDDPSRRRQAHISQLKLQAGEGTS